MQALALAILASCSANDDIHTPAIGAVSPARSTVGANVVVSGNYFCGQPEPDDPDDVDPLACQNIGTVTFDTVPATPSQYTDTVIIVEVPDLTSGPVTVFVSVVGRTSNGIGFIVE